ncbi:hypothetical protein [Flavicella marina]|uniref:hypothetical protein n=1 Tax=Flavicella marina TaxID=1475951 RepID=UPI0012647438|nr:hypothetical protein [Flavicella marina]
MIQKNIAIALIAFSTAFVSCKDNEEETQEMTTSQLTLDIEGLEDLGNDYKYEGWIIVDGEPVTTGVFSVDANGDLSETKFDVDKVQLENASKFVLSIEPTNDPDPKPSDTKYLVGDFSGSSATLGTGIIADFSSVAGQFVLATPSDNATNAMNNENGIWWLKPGDPATAGLTLPDLPTGWKYEGWVVVDGTPITTGTFSNVNAADDSAPYSGMEGTPGYPGEDFLTNAPSGVTFPLDVRGKTAVISIEPYPDNSPAPFKLKPLVGMVGQETAPVLNTMNDNVNASTPTGSVWR